MSGPWGQGQGGLWGEGGVAELAESPRRVMGTGQAVPAGAALGLLFKIPFVGPKSRERR